MAYFETALRTLGADILAEELERGGTTCEEDKGVSREDVAEGGKVVRR
jgi:hypothetical protein